MFFEYPKLLWLLAVPALLVLRYLYVELKDRRPHLRVSSVTPWKKGGKTVLRSFTRASSPNLRRQRRLFHSQSPIPRKKNGIRSRSNR